MKALIIQRRIHGLEMWQVYSATGLVSQWWSREYAEAVAARLKVGV